VSVSGLTRTTRFASDKVQTVLLVQEGVGRLAGLAHDILDYWRDETIQLVNESPINPDSSHIETPTDISILFCVYRPLMINLC
jgi:hypothetical protein